MELSLCNIVSLCVLAELELCDSMNAGWLGGQVLQTVPVAWVCFAGRQSLDGICILQEDSIALNDNFMLLLFFIPPITCYAME